MTEEEETVRQPAGQPRQGPDGPVAGTVTAFDRT